MNKLKKLFSPRALATTLATGMLLHSAVTALADCAYSEPAYRGSGSCGGAYPVYCSGYVSCFDGQGYWCCPSGTTCESSSTCFMNQFISCYCWCDCQQ